MADKRAIEAEEAAAVMQDPSLKEAAGEEGEEMDDIFTDFMKEQEDEVRVAACLAVPQLLAHDVVVIEETNEFSRPCGNAGSTGMYHLFYMLAGAVSSCTLLEVLLLLPKRPMISSPSVRWAHVLTEVSGGL